jgi:hypothetical protein
VPGRDAPYLSAVPRLRWSLLAVACAALMCAACGTGSPASPGPDASTRDAGSGTVDATSEQAAAPDDAGPDVEDAAEGVGEDGGPGCPPSGQADAGCGDLQTDPRNCGGCGNDCEGGACQEAGCAALPPGVIATGQHAPVSLGVDDVNVYWISAGTSCVIPGGGGGSGGPPVKPIIVPLDDGQVVKCAKSGCGNRPTVLASRLTMFGLGATAGNFAVDGAGVYWSGPLRSVGSAIFRCAVNGCSDMPVALWSGQVGARGIAVDSNRVYWTGGPSGTDVADCPIGGCDGGAPATLATGQALLSGVATDGVNVYWRNLGQILACPVAGCGAGPVVLASSQSTAGGQLALDATNVYWLNASGAQGGQVMKCAKAGCGGAPTALASGGVQPVALAVDGSSVYWTDSSSVLKCAVSGCGGAPSFVADYRSSPGAIAVDATRVYWAEGATSGFGGTIVSAAK